MRQQTAPLNEAIDRVNETAYFSGPEGIDATQFPSGVVYDDTRPKLRDQWFYAVLVTKGPDKKSSDFTTAQYWARRVVAVQTGGQTAADNFKWYVDTSNDTKWWGIVHIVPDVNGGKHTLRALDDYSEKNALPEHAVIVRVEIIDGRKINAATDEGASSFAVGLPVAGTSEFWAKITGSAANGTNKWKYAWTEVRRTATGWENKPNGRTGTTTEKFALNSIEANNPGAAGIMGNSVDTSETDFPAGMSLKPVRGDPVVRMIAESDASGTTTYTFSYENAVDGPCEA